MTSDRTWRATHRSVESGDTVISLIRNLLVMVLTIVMILVMLLFAPILIVAIAYALSWLTFVALIDWVLNG